jgi:hypothetical protein
MTSKHYRWERRRQQPIWPTAIVLIAALEICTVAAIAAALAFRALLS